VHERKRRERALAQREQKCARRILRRAVGLWRRVLDSGADIYTEREIEREREMNIDLDVDVDIYIYIDR